ncbi:MAG TPA: hypothetical protein PKY82_21065 [Pyrinomonadaceae bacterium]|nr:hypothetical protein [Pyrinomonadaceae bacterium]
MVKVAFVWGIIVSTINPFFAQDLLKKAEKNPLDCAFYLLQKDNERYFGDVKRLAYTFLELSNYAKSKITIELLEDKDYRFSNFVNFSTKLLKEGKIKETNNFLDFALKNLDKKNLPDKRIVIEFVDNLVKINRLNDAQIVVESFRNENEIEEICIKFAFSLLKQKKTSEILTLINRPYFPINSNNNEIRANVALILAKLNQNKLSLKILKEIEEHPFLGKSEIETENNRRFILPILLQTYLQLNQPEQAIKRWNQYGNSEDYYEISNLVNLLIDFGQNQKALKLTGQMLENKIELERKGSYVVSIFVRLGKIDKAFETAQNISEKNDSYTQQESFMKIADYFIRKKNSKKATEILDFALQKAKQVDFQHETMQSNGASSGTRKRTYLQNIYNRYMKLNEFDKAFLAINSINSKHWIANEFVATKNIDFAKQQYKTLPKAKILELLKQSENVIKDEEELHLIEIKLLSAEIYALIGDKNTAVALISQVLDEAKESCCYEDDFLVSAGKVFEKYKLKTTPNLQKALRNIIDPKY